MGGNMGLYKDKKCYMCRGLGHQGRDYPLAQRFRQFLMAQESQKRHEDLHHSIQREKD